MTNRFEVSHANYGARAMREILKRQIETAVEELPRGRPTDEEVHSIRKHMKAARGTLRLLRPLLSDRDYRTENRALRDAARAFGAARDGAVLVETLEALMQKAKGNGARRSLAAFETELKEDADRRRIRLARRGLRHSAAQLRVALRRVHSWPEPEMDWRAVCRSLRASYSKGRQCARRNERNASAGTLHEWRKRAKYLRSQLEVIEPVQHASLQTMSGELHQLSDQLGEEHDLTVLGDLAHQRGLERKAERSLRKIIKRKRRKLRKWAISVGRPLYSEKPAHFEARLRRYFRHWN